MRVIVFKEKSSGKEVYVNIDGMYAAGKAKSIYDEFHTRYNLGIHTSFEEVVSETFKALHIPFNFTADDALIYEA